MKEFTFTWHIENYSYCWHKADERLMSPVFVADTMEGTAWTLSLHPRGMTPSDLSTICYSLHRVKRKEGPDSFGVNFQFSFLSTDRSNLKHDGEYTFHKGCTYECLGFAARNEVLIESKESYLPNDTLTVICRMWTGDGGVSESGKGSARTLIGVQRVAYVHSVGQFSKLVPDLRKTVHIGTGPSTKPQVAISAYATSGPCCEGRIVVEVCPTDVKEISLSTFKVRLLDAAGNRIKCGETDARFYSVAKDIVTVPLSLWKDLLMSSRDQYLPNDTLSLHCECAFTTGAELEKMEQIDYGIPLFASSAPRTRDLSRRCLIKTEERLFECPEMSEDLWYMYRNQILTDMRVDVQTETFHVHASVLCARSSVFRAMFSSDMEERASRCVEIEDLEVDTVRQLLLYLYTDVLEVQNSESVCKLYYAADKYQVQRLKLSCTSFLMSDLSVSNATKILTLADRHVDTDLKAAVEDFIVEHDVEIFCSEEWRAFMDSHPVLAVKTMHLKYRRQLIVSSKII